ncbi:MAG TPA: hypothetical protein VNK04_13415 [Gemmataceae bacterium]|nr:hypothetical protein [Gemmataceae bacterium]
MARPTFEQAMRALLQRKPFQPFAIEFDNGEQWVVEQPEMLFYYTGDSALYFRPDGSLSFVDCDNVKQLVELPQAPAT